MALSHRQRFNHFALFAILAVGSCNRPDILTETSQELEQPKTSIMIRTMAGKPKEKALLVEPTRDVRSDQLADAVRETGNPCEGVTAFSQLEQNGRVMDIYKLDCRRRSYQVTVLNDSTHLKPWTGKVFCE